VAADGGFILAHYNLATLLKDSGLPGEALAAYREVLRLDPQRRRRPVQRRPSRAVLGACGAPGA
jgi:hypothetical protein